MQEDTEHNKSNRNQDHVKYARASGDCNGRGTSLRTGIPQCLVFPDDCSPVLVGRKGARKGFVMRRDR